MIKFEHHMLTAMLSQLRASQILELAHYIAVKTRANATVYHVVHSICTEAAKNEDKRIFEILKLYDVDYED